MKFIYTITSACVHNGDKETSSYLLRICDTKEQAVELMQSIFDDAESERPLKHGKMINPKWLDEHHRRLEVTHVCCCGWIRTETKEVYQLNQEAKDTMFSKKIWMYD